MLKLNGPLLDITRKEDVEQPCQPCESNSSDNGWEEAVPEAIGGISPMQT